MFLFSSLSYYVNLDGCLNLAVQTGCSLVLAELLDRLNGDHLLVHLDALCSQSVSDLLCGNRTEDLAVLVSLGGNADYSCTSSYGRNRRVP